MFCPYQNCPHCSQCFSANTSGRSLLWKCAKTLETLQEFQHHKKQMSKPEIIHALMHNSSQNKDPWTSLGQKPGALRQFNLRTSPVPRATERKLSGWRGCAETKKQPPQTWKVGFLAGELSSWTCVCVCTWNESSRFHPGPWGWGLFDGRAANPPLKPNQRLGLMHKPAEKRKSLPQEFPFPAGWAGKWDGQTGRSGCCVPGCEVASWGKEVKNIPHPILPAAINQISLSKFGCYKSPGEQILGNALFLFTVRERKEGEIHAKN